MTAITLVELPPFDQLHPVGEPAEALRLGETFALYPTPTLFELHRIVDVTGVSGAGRVAAGVIWPLIGGAVMRWSTPRPPANYPTKVRQIELVDSIAEIMGVHGHSGSTRLRLLDPCNPPATTPYDHDMPEAFAVVDPADDVTGWGVWFPRDERALLYRPERSMLGGAQQGHRIATYRGLTSLVNDLPAPARDGQHQLVYLATAKGRKLITRVNAAYVEQLKRARMALDLATRDVAGAADLRRQLGMSDPIA